MEAVGTGIALRHIPFRGCTLYAYRYYRISHMVSGFCFSIHYIILTIPSVCVPACAAACTLLPPNFSYFMQGLPGQKGSKGEPALVLQQFQRNEGKSLHADSWVGYKLSSPGDGASHPMKNISGTTSASRQYETDQAGFKNDLNFCGGNIDRNVW